MLTLAAKLRHLIRRRSPDPVQPLSPRKLSAAMKALPGHTRGGSPTAINNLTRGVDDNPTVATLIDLAQILEAPAPFLLPGWDDVRALAVFQGDPRVADILRHLEGLPRSDLDEFLERLKKRRVELGMPQDCDPEPIEYHDIDPVDRADPRKRSPEESARYAADSLEGL